MRSDPDPLSDLLRVLHVSGALVLHDSYATPWSVSVPASASLAQIAGLPVTERVVAFHLVQEGQLLLTSEGCGPVTANTGDLLIALGGLPHLLSLGDGARSIPLASLVGPANNVPKPRIGTSECCQTRLMCGVFGLGPLDRSPLLGALPPFVHIPSGASETLDALVGVMTSEVDRPRPGSGFVMARLLELVCSEALRHVAANFDPAQSNWLRALADPAVHAAMAAVHRDPGRDWTVRHLANEAALSPSRLTVRFRLALGQSPMSYVGQWRMVVAARLLTDSDAQVQQVAGLVGYSDQPSFSRAFQRSYGLAPRDYRARSSKVGTAGTSG